MNDLGNRCLDAEIAAVPVDAGVIGESFGVAAQAELIVRLVEIACAKKQFSLIVAFKTGTRDDVKDSVSSVTELCAITSTIRFHVVNIFGIELRPNVRSDIGIGHRNAINQPTSLMCAADVELIVRDIGSGNVVGNHG